MDLNFTEYDINGSVEVLEVPDIGLFGSPVGIISGHSQIGRKITVVKYGPRAVQPDK